MVNMLELEEAEEARKRRRQRREVERQAKATIEDLTDAKGSNLDCENGGAGRKQSS